MKWIRTYFAKRFIYDLSRLRKVVILTHEGSSEWPELHNIEVIPNPISSKLTNKQSNCLNKKVIAVGRYVPQKGFDMLISTWQKVLQKHPDWELNIFGDGQLKQSYQRLIDKLGINESCFLRASVKNIYDEYIESSIFVLSSRYEGLPLVLGEAMSYGVAPNFILLSLWAKRYD